MLGSLFSDVSDCEAAAISHLLVSREPRSAFQLISKAIRHVLSHSFIMTCVKIGSPECLSRSDTRDWSGNLLVKGPLSEEAEVWANPEDSGGRGNGMGTPFQHVFLVSKSNYAGRSLDKDSWHFAPKLIHYT